MTTDVLDKSNDIEQNQINKSGYGGCILPASGIIIGVLFVTNLISGFWDNAKDIQKLTAYSIIGVIILAIVLTIYNVTSEKQKKDTIKNNKKLIESIINNDLKN